MKITVKESNIVYPAEDTSSRRIWLSNLDLAYDRHFPLVYMYEPDGSSDFFDVKILKEALSKVLVPFYPLAGRFGRDENGRLEINCKGEGVVFVEAEADCPMSYFNDFTPGREYLALIPKLDPSTGISSLPFFLAQVTKFSCGGVCLGVFIHHTVVDAQATFHFMNSWSETARGLSLTIPPVHERSLLRAREPPTPKFNHIEYDETPKFKPGAETEERISVAGVKFPVEFVNYLKAKVSKESNLKYSTFEILSAYIWRCTSKLQNLPDDQENSLVMPVNCRQRLQPPLPEGYFGNAAFLTTARVSNGELMKESLGKTVERIHTAIVKMNDEYLKSTIDYFEKTDPSEIYINNAKTATFLANSWARMEVACADFGWGGPSHRRLAGDFTGILFLPSINKDNTLSAVVGLFDEQAKFLEKLLNVLELY